MRTIEPLGLVLAGFRWHMFKTRSNYCVWRSIMASPVQSILEQRRDQIFPKLDLLDIKRLRRFGEARSFVAG